MHDLEFDLSRSLKVKLDGAIRKSIYDFLLVNNSIYIDGLSLKHLKWNFQTSE